ncbi:hypothetical protein ACFX1X_022680 [Malus domestica]
MSSYSTPELSDSSSNDGVGVAIVVVLVVVLVKIVIAVVVCKKCQKLARERSQNVSLVQIVTPDHRTLTMEKIVTPDFRALTMHNFINDMEREKPASNGTPVAVKVLHGSSDKRIKEQFTAEVSTIGRIHHINLVRLYGFCFEEHLRALVYEYMGNGSLDKYLFRSNTVVLGFEQLHEIAVGTERGIAYLHEECQQRIVHYDIKPENILLDAKFFPKVADFGFAKLCNRDNTHITMTGGRGTPGYAAPEVWQQFPITHKCDVYSFGMLLFEIIGRRRNLDVKVEDGRDWRCAWKKFEPRRIRRADGAVEIPRPSTNPFQHLMSDTPYPAAPVYDTSNPTTSTSSDFCSVPSQTVNGYRAVDDFPIMKKYEIEIASN